MFANYFIIAWRNLTKNKLYSVVNMSSLTLSLTVVMLISIYVKDDISFDHFHTNGPQLFRLVQERQEADRPLYKMGNTGYPQGPAFKKEIPDIVDYCRIKNGWNTLIRHGDQGIKEKLMYADNSIFSMFTFKTVFGNQVTPLNDLNHVVITDKLAKKYFGDTDPTGKILEVGDEASDFKPFVIAAVVKNPPSNSTIQFDLLLSFDQLLNSDPDQKTNSENWYNASLNTFILIRPSTDMGLIQQKLDQVTTTYAASTILENKKRSKDGKSIFMQYHLQPFYQMHLDAAYYATNGMEYWSNALYPKVLSGLAFMILFIACINFINLTLARSFHRAKEIGIRKTAGGSRMQLFSQFISESFLICTLTFLPALAIANWFLPSFSRLTDKYLDKNVLFQSQSLVLFTGLLIVIGFLAGFYPAIVLSGYHPIDSIKGKFKRMSRQELGKALIIIQFTLASVMILCTAIALRQFHYITNTDLGYKTEDRLRFWLPWDKIQRIAPEIKHDLMQSSYIKQVSAKSGDWNSTMYDINGKRSDYIYYEHIDENHLQLMGIPLVSGRYFSNEFSTDTSENILVNESFVHTYIPIGADPFNAVISQGARPSHIVGVVKDFYYGSFKEKIKPIVWMKDAQGQAGCIHVQIDGSHYKEAIAHIREVYRRYVPYLPLDYQFLEDFRMQRYKDDLRWKHILTYSAFMVIFIACIGLFALASFTIEQRTKEIGIRKVLGATVYNISSMVIRKFLILIVISIILAFPVGYTIMNKWLQDFAYRIDIHWGYFLLTAFLALSISGMTIGFQAVKAALANPVKSIRTE